MKRFLALFMTLVLLCSSAIAETAAAAPAQGEQLTLEDIQALNDGKAKAFFQNDQLTFLDGTCASTPVKSVEDAAGVVSSMIGLLGGDEKTHFEPWRVLNDSLGNVYYVYQQTYADLIVLGGAVKIITDAEGNMLGLTGSVAANLPEANESNSSLTAEQAEAIVIQQEISAHREEPVIMDGMTRKIVLPVDRIFDINEDEINTRFVWAVYTTNPSASVSAGNELPYLAHYVTLAGEYLYALPTILPGDAVANAGYHANYVFQFMEPADYTGYVDMADGSEKEITVTLMRDTRTGMYYLGNIERKIVVGDCWEFLYNGGRVVLEYSPDNLEWDQTGLKSLYNYCRAYDYYKEIGWEGADGEGTPIIILKDFCDPDHTPVNNAAYAAKIYGWQAFLSSSINSFSECLDVLGHEFTHCVTGTVMTHNAYMNDFGAINEAMSDIQGNICEMMMGATEDETWLLGETINSPIRSMSQPHLFGQPKHTWDLYYKANVKTSTEVNDHGGVHTNSSLLNNVAYRLCVHGGMTLPQARDFWFAVDCAMVPGSDYPQLRQLLPWVLKIMGLDAYQGAMTEALEATRLGDSELPEALAEGRALLTLKLPDNEVFNNGFWMLNVYSLNPEKLMEKVDFLMEKAKKGDTDDLPNLLRMILGIFAPQPASTPMPAEKEEKEGFFKSFLRILEETLTEEQEEKEQPKQQEGSPESDDMQELIQWFKTNAEEVFYIGSGNAGQDGHTVTIVGIPGRAIPVLFYLETEPGGAQLKQVNVAIYLNHHWIDMTEWFDESTLNRQKEDPSYVRTKFLESDLLSEIIAMFTDSKSLTDILDSLTLDIQDGQVYEIPADGLEKLDLRFNMAMGAKDETVVVNKKSRPKLPEEELPSVNQ